MYQPRKSKNTSVLDEHFWNEANHLLLIEEDAGPRGGRYPLRGVNRLELGEGCRCSATEDSGCALL